MKNPEQGHISDSSAPELRALIARFVTGESDDFEALQATLKGLQAAEPTALSWLRARITEPFDEACLLVSDVIPDYAALDEDIARQEMPEVYEHLQTCENCRAELDALQQAIRDSSAWARPSPVPSDMLALVKGVWQRFESAVRRIGNPVGEQDVQNRLGVGTWVLKGLSPQFALAEGGHADIVELETHLPDDLASIVVQVNPQYQVSSDKTIWRIVANLMKTPATPKNFTMRVAYGSRERQEGGTQALRLNRSVEFQFAPPPPGDTYWLYFMWYNQEQEEQYRIALPLTVGSER